jgi:hypothetical protein
LTQGAVIHPEISVEKEQVLRQMGSVRKPELFTSLAEELVQEARALWRPAVCWSVYKIETDHKAGKAVLSLANGECAGTLDVGKRSVFLDKAVECFVAAATVGALLSERIAEFEREGNITSSYMMDVIGVLALHATHAQFRRIVEDYASKYGWGTGPVMQPGTLNGWKLEEQEKLLKLVPISEIDVSLNAQFMMTPSKSNSCLIGVGPGYESSGPGCLCEECPRKRCPWRRTREYGFELVS